MKADGPEKARETGDSGSDVYMHIHHSMSTEKKQSWIKNLGLHYYFDLLHKLNLQE